jgi:lipoate-protein ligase A
MEPSWQLWVDETARPGWSNMSIDMALLDQAEQQAESWLRLYRWEPGCLSFGRHEPASRRYDAERIRRLGLDAVRRPTGGRAVWHESELTYAVACPYSRFPSLRDAYLEIHRLLAEALRSVGIEAVLAPRIRTAALDSGACFSQPAGGEVLVDGRKVIGSAQLRRGSALLQHGSILLRDDQHRVGDLVQGGSGAPSSALDTASPLARLQPQELAKAVTGSARIRWAPVWACPGEPGGVLDRAALHSPQFRSSAWTWAK